MRSSYKKLGNYIREVDIRNTDLSLNLLLGISIQKIFIPSIANIIGTDMTTYKIVKKKQFGYGTVTSRNGDKISIALLENNDEAIVSQAYKVFEIIDEKELLPEYLMMWFRRPEFDRYARFKSHGSAREIFDWQEMCNMDIPLPSITKQQEIVDEYNVIKERITLNSSLIGKLEETAQAVYREWFVDGIDEENLPSGWKMGKIDDFSKEIITGKTPSTDDETNFHGDIPFLTIPDMHNKTFVFSTERYLSEKGTLKNKILPINSICVSCIGTAGLVVLNANPSQTNQQINSIIPKQEYYLYYLYLTIKSLENKIKEWGGKGSIGINMNKSEFSDLEIVLPEYLVLKNFNELVKCVFEIKKNYEKENENLGKMKNLILSKMASEG